MMGQSVVGDVPCPHTSHENPQVGGIGSIYVAKDNSAGALAFVFGFFQLYLMTVAGDMAMDWLSPIFGVGGATFIVLAFLTFMRGNQEDDGYLRNPMNLERDPDAKTEEGSGMFGKVIIACAVFYGLASLIQAI
jgi:hypothetical protein